MKIQTVIEWAVGIFASLAGAVGIFFTVRAAYMSYLKEISVGASALKKRDERFDAIERRLSEMELKTERNQDKIKTLEKDSDEHYEDLKNLDDKIDIINRELKHKTL